MKASKLLNFHRVFSLSQGSRLKHLKVQRKPLQKFKPAITTPIQKWEKLERSYDEEMDEIVELKQPEKINEELKPDYLPKGMSLADLPKFERILGWDKNNPILR